MTERSRYLALRGLCYGLVFVWLSKWDFFAAAARIYLARPLHDPFFPPLFQSFALLALAFAVPPVLAFGALLSGSHRALALSLGAFAFGSLALMAHQGSYNDATFVTSFWVALTGLWLARAVDGEDAPVSQRAAYLAQLVIGLQFFGGALGKLTPGYLDGSVLHGIYFADREHFTFALLRQVVDAGQLEAIARVYSRSIVALELLLATLPLWPARPALWTALVALSGLVLLNNFRLFSVVGSLIALAAVALFLQERRPAGARLTYAVS